MLRFYFMLVRPPLSFLGLLLSVGLLRLCGLLDFVYWFLVFGIFFINMSFNVLNEIVDREVDRFKPFVKKPLAHGLIPLKHAWIMFATFYSLGVFFLAMFLIHRVDVVYILLSCVGVVSGFIYNLWLRDCIGTFFQILAYASAFLMCTYPTKYMIHVLWFSAVVFTQNMFTQFQDMEFEKKFRKTCAVQLSKYMKQTLYTSAFTTMTLAAICNIYAPLPTTPLIITLILSTTYCIATFITKKETIELIIRKIARLLLLILATTLIIPHV